MKALSLLLTAGALYVGVSAFEKPQAEDGIGDFHAWAKVNKTPQFMSAATDALCRNATPKELARLKLDPHVHKYITVYVNAVGSQAMKEGAVFPVGSTIVKEKRQGTEGPVELSTVMIKHDAGYNPKCGDWEFLTLDSTGKKITSRGKIESCMKCHETQKKLDYTYRTYGPKPPKPGSPPEGNVLAK